MEYLDRLIDKISNNELSALKYFATQQSLHKLVKVILIPPKRTSRGSWH